MKNRRLWCLVLTGVLVISSFGCGKSAETVETAAEETDQAVEIAEEAVSRSSGGSVEKAETVYVNADASGTVTGITVSNWLKNGDGADELTDVTRLTDVANVKGDETFTQNGDTYVWAAAGNDIYYQGETSEALPVNVKVTYYLDDKEIEPAELAGKSGKVKIRFDYENQTMQQAVIGGEKTQLCVPFIAASTLILDSDKFVNVEVENGKILSDGKNTIVAGVAMPGLYESLDLQNLDGFEDIDIPEYVEVTADVTEFELAMTATILMPDVFGELDTDDIDGFDDLKDDIEELNDATYELIDGCIELDDGVQELKDNMPDLWDGAVELDDGAWELDDGAQDLLDGADELNDGAKEIREGAKELDDGVGALQSGAGLLNDSMPELTNGAAALAGGLLTLQNSMMLGTDGKSGDAEHPYIKTSVGLLKDGVDALAAGVSGMGSTLNQAIADNEAQMQAEYQEIVVLKGNLDTAVQSAQKTQTELEELAEKCGLSSSGGDSTGSGQEDTKEGSPEDGQTETTETVTEEAQEKQSKAEDAAAASSEEPVETKNDTEAAPEETKEEGSVKTETDAEAAPEETKEEGSVKTETDTEAVPEETKEEGSVKTETDAEAAPEETKEEGSEEPEAQPAATEEASGFAETYLQSLSESDGMTPMGMVQLSEPETGTDPGPESEETLKATLEVYKRLAILQTQLITELNQITEYQSALQEATMKYAALQGADTALRQIAGQLSGSADAEQLARLTEGMAALEISVGQIYDGVALINSQMGTLTGGAEKLSQGVGALKDGTDALKAGTEKLYKGGKDLREGTKELYDGTQELKDGTEELKDGTQELKDGVVDLIDGVDELKDGTEELLDGVYEYNEDGIQKLYETVTVDLQNLVDRVDAIAELSRNYQSFSGKRDDMEGSVKFIIETEAIETAED